MRVRVPVGVHVSVRVRVRMRVLRGVERRVVLELVVVVEPHLLLVVGLARLAAIARAQEGRDDRFRYRHAAGHWN